MAEKQDGSGTVLAWHQRFVELEHPNPYIAFVKSSAWATLAFVFVSFLAIVSSSAVEYLFFIFFPQADGLFIFLVECFGYAATTVSFLLLIIVMIVESRILIKQLQSKGNALIAPNSKEDDVGPREVLGEVDES